MFEVYNEFVTLDGIGKLTFIQFIKNKTINKKPNYYAYIECISYIIL